ncbi:hypothetical protein TorRG33x02_206860, partial [Trema orientale]
NSTVGLSLFRVIVGDDEVVYGPVENEGINIVANGRLAIIDLGEIGNRHLVAENGFIQGSLFRNIFVNGNIGNRGIANCDSGGGRGGVPVDIPGTPNPFNEEADLVFGPPMLENLPPPLWEDIPINTCSTQYIPSIHSFMS